jgi:hypothetical protein
MIKVNKLLWLLSAYWQIVGVLVLFLILILDRFEFINITNFSNIVIPVYLVSFLMLQFLQSLTTFIFFCQKTSLNICELSVLFVYPLSAFSTIHLIWDNTFSHLDLFFLSLLALISVIYTIRQLLLGLNISFENVGVLETEKNIN